MKKFNVLVYGSGAREHGLVDKILQSPLLGKLFLALPNDGFKYLGEEIIFSDFEDLAQKCVQNAIDLVVIGPEAPLAKGIVDIFQAQGIKCIGTNKFWTQLESSKKFAKEFMGKYDIETAKYLVMDDAFDVRLLQSHLTPTLSPQGRGSSSLNHFESPPVIKADGLAAGKGVHISKSFEDAQNCIEEFLSGKFGEASKTVIVEEKLQGEELSLISLFDGETLLPFIPARDYKKLLDNDKGPNTGGMGAYCPIKLTSQEENDLADYLKKLETALKSEKADFCGVIYSGLILTNKGIKVLEFNMRFGDPETQALLMHLDSDLLEIFIKMTQKKLSEVKLKWKKGTSVCIVIAADGYPVNPKIGKEIKIGNYDKDIKIFYAGVKNKNGKLFSSGGRILSVCNTSENIKHAREKVYNSINQINLKDKIFRSDIGL